jgi:uncharacterized RDD family membrane protein YckC
MTETGPYAGAVSRLLAYAVDHITLSALFAAGLAGTAFLTNLVTGRDIDLSASAAGGAALAVWWVAYFAVSWAVTGATLGMALFGVRVVRVDGMPVAGGRALVRALAFPLSVLLFGLGFLGIVFHAQRRALHDLIAGTVVVYTAVVYDEASRRGRIGASRPVPPSRLAPPAESSESSSPPSS